jgi:uncharacterized protein
MTPLEALLLDAQKERHEANQLMGPRSPYEGPFATARSPPLPLLANDLYPYGCAPPPPAGFSAADIAAMHPPIGMPPIRMGQLPGEPMPQPPLGYSPFVVPPQQPEVEQRAITQKKEEPAAARSPPVATTQPPPAQEAAASAAGEDGGGSRKVEETVCLGPSSLQCFGLRMPPGTEVYTGLKRLVTEHGLRAACILSCVGSVTRAKIRLASADKDNRDPVLDVIERCEVVSMSGTLSPDGIHIHVSLADGQGKVVGGHLMAGTEVFTTMELVIGEMPQLSFRRLPCEQTGFTELTVQRRKD